MGKIRDLFNRLLSSGVDAPSEPAPSMFRADAKVKAEARANDIEMQMAIEKERARRGGGAAG